MHRSFIAGQRAWAIAPLTLACAATAVPYLLAHHLPAASWILREGFTLVCHQRPERSFWILGAPVAVCARCFGIYIGAAFGLLVRTSRRLAFQLLAVTASLNLLDVVSESVGLHANWLGLRFLLGLTVGVSAAMLIASTRESDAAPA